MGSSMTEGFGSNVSIHDDRRSPAGAALENEGRTLVTGAYGRSSSPDGAEQRTSTVAVSRAAIQKRLQQLRPNRLAILPIPAALCAGSSARFTCPRERSKRSSQPGRLLRERRPRR